MVGRYRSEDISVLEKDRPVDFGAFLHRVAMKLQAEGQRCRQRRGCGQELFQLNTSYIPPSSDYLLESKKHLAAGRPLVIWTVFPDAFSSSQGRMEIKLLTTSQYARAKSTWHDQHAMALVGYTDDAEAEGGGWFSVLNSHGPQFGSDGVGRMSYDYFREFVKDIWYPTGEERIDLEVDFFDGQRVLKH